MVGRYLSFNQLGCRVFVGYLGYLVENIESLYFSSSLNFREKVSLDCFNKV